MLRLKVTGEENGIRIDNEDEDVPPQLRIKEKFASFRKYMNDRTNSRFTHLHNIITQRKSRSKLGKSPSLPATLASYWHDEGPLSASPCFFCMVFL